MLTAKVADIYRRKIRAVNEVPLHDIEIGDWCAVCLCVQRIIGLAFFNEIINYEFYIRLILSPFIKLTGEGKLYKHFMQDNIVAHIANNSVDALDGIFLVDEFKLKTVTSIINQFKSL
jgi:hypothetical protein